VLNKTEQPEKIQYPPLVCSTHSPKGSPWRDGAGAWPLAARAQQPALPVIGFLRSSSIERFPHLVAAFLQGLKETGYVEGQNVTIEYRSAEGQYDRLAALAADLVQRRVNIIVATGGSAFVFTAASDPVRDGLVASLNQPGGNLTGFSLLSFDVGSKRVGLLRELIPNATTIALLLNPKNSELGQHLQEVQRAARSLGLRIRKSERQGCDLWCCGGAPFYRCRDCWLVFKSIRPHCFRTGPAATCQTPRAGSPPTGSNGHSSRIRSCTHRRAATRRGSRLCSCSSMTLATYAISPLRLWRSSRVRSA
jgi:ABC transporter substrate binding protein